MLKAYPGIQVETRLASSIAATTPAPVSTRKRRAQAAPSTTVKPMTTPHTSTKTVASSVPPKASVATRAEAKAAATPAPMSTRRSARLAASQSVKAKALGTSNRQTSTIQRDLSLSLDTPARR